MLIGAFTRLLFFVDSLFQILIFYYDGLKSKKWLDTTTFAIAKVVCYHMKIKNCHKNNEKE